MGEPPQWADESAMRRQMNFCRDELDNRRGKPELKWRDRRVRDRLLRLELKLRLRRGSFSIKPGRRRNHRQRSVAQPFIEPLDQAMCDLDNLCRTSAGGRRREDHLIGA